MKKFVRRALRRQSSSSASPTRMPSDAEPDDHPADPTLPLPPSPPPSPSRPRRRHLRFPLRASRSFVAEGPPSANLSGDKNESNHTDLVDPQPDIQQPLDRAPVFYDMYDTPGASRPPSLHRFPRDPPDPVPQLPAEARQLSFSREYYDSRPPTHYSTLSATNLSVGAPPMSSRLRPRHNSFSPDFTSSSPTDTFETHRSSPPRSRTNFNVNQLRERMHDASATIPGVNRRQQSYSFSTLHRPPSDARFEFDAREHLAQSSPSFAYQRHNQLPSEHQENPGRHSKPSMKDNATTAAATTAGQSFPSPMQRNLNPPLTHAHGPPTTPTPRPIEESPFSCNSFSSLQHVDSSSSVEARLYTAYTDALHEEARSRAGGLRTIVNLLRDCDGNPVVIEKAALAIACLCERDAATRDVLGQYAAVQTLIQCLSIRIPSRCDRVSAVDVIVRALAALLRDSPRNVRLFDMFDGAHKMGKAAASERYENHPAIPTHALNALAELKHHPALSSDADASQLLAPHGNSAPASSRTIRYVLRCMAIHEHRTHIQERGLDALRTLLSRAGEGMLSTHVLRACVQATATAFKMHKESREIQWQCLSLLCDLDDLRGDMFTVQLDVASFFGALRLVIAEAKHNTQRHPRVAKALMSLIRRAIDVAVANSWRHIDFKDAAVEAGAVETILEALQLYDTEIQVVDKICTILRVLLQSNEGRYRMNTVNSACAILAGIETANASAVRAAMPS